MTSERDIDDAEAEVRARGRAIQQAFDDRHKAEARALRQRLKYGRVLYPTKAEHMQPVQKTDTWLRHWPARRVVDASGAFAGYEADR